MCGRFTLRTPAAEVVRQFRLPGIPDLAPRYNIAPTQPVAAVRAAGEGADRELAMLRWGLIPSWAKDTKGGARSINARSETAATKPMFRAAFKRRRCLIPADSFYEWKSEAGGKQPYCIGLREGGLFAMAGLWERFGEGDAEIQSCAILTTEANSLLASLHDRMPVILPPDKYDIWLDPEIEDRTLLESLLTPFDSGEMRAYRVSKTVNRPTNDTPQCIQPLAEQ